MTAETCLDQICFDLSPAMYVAISVKWREDASAGCNPQRMPTTTDIKRAPIEVSGRIATTRAFTFYAAYVHIRFTVKRESVGWTPSDPSSQMEICATVCRFRTLF